MDFTAWNGTVEAIYAAASETHRWPDVLHAIAHLFDAGGCVLLYRHDNGHLGAIVSPALVAMAEVYDRSWRHVDTRAERAFHALSGAGRDICTDRDLFTDHEIATLPIYQQFLLPHGFLWGMTVSVSPSPDVSALLTVMRAKDKPSYTAEEQDRLLALSRHVERSLSLSLRLLDAEAQRLGLSEALNRVDCGVFVLDAGQRILFANRTAREVSGGGLSASAGRLRLSDAPAQHAFRRRLNDIASGEAATPGTCEALVVPDGEGSLILQILPLRFADDVPALRTATALVLVLSQDRNRPFDPAVLRDVFRLTLGEARMAALVGAGTAPREAAAALGIAENTARTVLKRVFEKMGVSRQGEMAALMGKLFFLRQT